MNTATKTKPEFINDITILYFLSMYRRCGRKVMRLIFYISKFFFSNINVIPFKIVSLGSYTPMDTLFPLFVAALEVFNWYGVQHVHYTLLDVLYKDVLERLRKRVVHVRPDIADKWTLQSWQRPMSQCPLSHRIFDLKSHSCCTSAPFHQSSVPGTFSFFLNLKMSSKDVISGL